MKSNCSNEKWRLRLLPHLFSHPPPVWSCIVSFPLLEGATLSFPFVGGGASPSFPSGGDTWLPPPASFECCLFSLKKQPLPKSREGGKHHQQHGGREAASPPKRRGESASPTGEEPRRESSNTPKKEGSKTAPFHRRQYHPKGERRDQHFTFLYIHLICKTNFKSFLRLFFQAVNCVGRNPNNFGKQLKAQAPHIRQLNK